MPSRWRARALCKTPWATPRRSPCSVSWPSARGRASRRTRGRRPALPPPRRSVSLSCRPSRTPGACNLTPLHQLVLLLRHPHLGLRLAQLEALYLARDGLGQVFDELHEVGVLVALEPLLTPGLQLLGEGIAAFIAFPQDDVGLHAGEVVYRDADLHRRDPEAADLDHVVRASLVPVEAFLVSPVPVAGEDPLALHSRLGLLVVAPVVGRGGIPLDREVPRLAILRGVAFLVEDLGLVTRNGCPAGAGLEGIRRVGDEDVQHLRGADAVEDGQAEGLIPAAPHAGGQRLGGRDAQAYRGEVVVRSTRVVEDRVVERRDREE